MSLPLEKEMQRALDHDLWLLRQSMAQEEPSLVEQGAYVVPARFYLPKLKMSLEIWEEARLRARDEIPKSLQSPYAKERVRGSLDSVAEVAKVAPEARRYWLLDRIHSLMGQAIEILENEGRPSGPPSNLKLVKTRGEREGQNEDEDDSHLL